MTICVLGKRAAERQELAPADAAPALRLGGCSSSCTPKPASAMLSRIQLNRESQHELFRILIFLQNTRSGFLSRESRGSASLRPGQVRPHGASLLGVAPDWAPGAARGDHAGQRRAGLQRPRSRLLEMQLQLPRLCFPPSWSGTAPRRVTAWRRTGLGPGGCAGRPRWPAESGLAAAAVAVARDAATTPGAPRWQRTLLKKVLSTPKHF